MKKILVVDDDTFVLNLVSSFLTKHNFEVETRNNGVDAISKIQNDTYDLIITDIVMPYKDGVQFMNEIREMDIYTPVLAMSGDKDGQNAEENLGFACYFSGDILTKPIQKETLIKSVNLALGITAG